SAIQPLPITGRHAPPRPEKARFFGVPTPREPASLAILTVANRDRLSEGARMPVTVAVRSGNAPAGQGVDDAPSLTFEGPRIVLGRGAGSDVRLPDPSVSTRHATIRQAGTEYAIVDE